MHQSTWDDPKKPSNRHTTSNPRHHESWNYTPLLRHTRRVLVIIDLEQVQHLMSARQSDVRQAPTCDALPSLGRLEQYALFTYSFLVTPAQTQILTVDTILYYISQHLNNTWGFYLEPSSMDLRWSDCTGDTFALRNHQLLIDLLREHRPHWTEGQEFRILNTIRDFDSPSQPYIMRMSCHQALPNPNMLPRLIAGKKRPTCCLHLLVSMSVSFDLMLFFHVLLSFLSQFGLCLDHD